MEKKIYTHKKTLQSEANANKVVSKHGKSRAGGGGVAGFLIVYYYLLLAELDCLVLRRLQCVAKLPKIEIKQMYMCVEFNLCMLASRARVQ